MTFSIATFSIATFCKTINKKRVIVLNVNMPNDIMLSVTNKAFNLSIVVLIVDIPSVADKPFLLIDIMLNFAMLNVFCTDCHK